MGRFDSRIQELQMTTLRLRRRGAGPRTRRGNPLPFSPPWTPRPAAYGSAESTTSRYR
ncbi:hypothetical protein I552_3537 [Mycobacterium xenopi 3993]|nr:hypothetical protein I552_3537 [Mycobacterium xenopi 3993]